MRAAIGVMCQQAREQQELLETTRSRGRVRNRLSLRASEGTRPASTLLSDVWPPELRENKSLLF